MNCGPCMNPSFERRCRTSSWFCATWKDAETARYRVTHAVEILRGANRGLDLNLSAQSGLSLTCTPSKCWLRVPCEPISGDLP